VAIETSKLRKDESSHVSEAIANLKFLLQDSKVVTYSGEKTNKTSTQRRLTSQKKISKKRIKHKQKPNHINQIETTVQTFLPVYLSRFP